MASIRKVKASSFWIAQWKDADRKTKSRSTGIPINPKSHGSIMSPMQAKLEALRVAQAYEQASKASVPAAKIRARVQEIISESFSEVSDVPTVNEWLDRVFADKSKMCAVGTMKCYRTAYREFCSFRDIGKKRVDEVTKKDVSDFISHLLGELSAGTVKRHMECVSVAFTQAYDAEIIDRSPAHRYEIPKMRVIDDRQSHDSFSRDQVDLLLRELPFEWRSMVLFSLYTGGQRLSDIQHLTWDMVDVDRNVISFTTGKTRHKVDLPIAKPLRDIIDEYPVDDRVGVIHKRFHKMRQTSLSNAFITHVIRLGLTERPSKGEGRRRNMIPLSFHALRATAVTLMYEAGISETIVKQIVGHESDAVNRIYRKFKSDTLSNALETI